MDDAIVEITELTVAGGAFLVSLTDRTDDILEGTLMLFVDGERRKFCVGRRPVAGSQFVRATSPALIRISQGWGDAKDTGKTLKVCYQSDEYSAEAVIP